MNTDDSGFGIQGRAAPAWQVSRWVDADGHPTPPVELAHLAGRWKIVFCFQHACPGCHSHGLPALQAMVQALDGAPGVALLAVQTVFEDFDANTYDAMLEFRARSGLRIPFAHDPGTADTGGRSNIMWHYVTGGTPWFIVIDPHDRVVFNHYQIAAASVVAYLKGEGQAP